VSLGTFGVVAIMARAAMSGIMAGVGVLVVVMFADQW